MRLALDANVSHRLAAAMEVDLRIQTHPDRLQERIKGVHLPRTAPKHETHFELRPVEGSH